jgi:hypothetical protein
MRAFLLMFLMMFTVSVLADEVPKKVETDKQSWHFEDDIFLGIVPFGILALGSKDPKAMGGFLLVITPTVGLSYKGGSTLPVYIAGGYFVGWAWYNITKLDKRDYSEGEIFRRNMANPLGLVGLVLGPGWLLKQAMPDTKANINITPLNDGAILSLSSTF